MGKWTGPRLWTEPEREWAGDTVWLWPADTSHAQSCTSPGGANIVDLDDVAAASHAQSAGAATLSQQYILTVANTAQAQTAGVPDLHFKLAPANASHAHTATALSFTTEDVALRTWEGDRTWADTGTREWMPGLPDANIADCNHVVSGVVPSLTQHHELVAYADSHAHSATATTAQAIARLVLFNAAHAASSTIPVLTSKHVLAAASANHAQSATASALPYYLAPVNTLHGHTAQAVTITAIGQVTNTASASQAQSATVPILTEGHVFLVNNATHDQTTTQPTLAEIEASSLLALANATHAHSAGLPELTILHALFAANISHAHAASSPRVQSSEFKILGPIRRPSIDKARGGRGISAASVKSISAG